MTQRQFQQGDVCIFSVDEIPQENLKPKKTNIVREGESTGHHHALEGEQGKDFNLFTLGDRQFAEILTENVYIVHPEHGAIPIPKGKFEIVPVQEYDHFTEETRQVRD